MKITPQLSNTEFRFILLNGKIPIEKAWNINEFEYERLQDKSWLNKKTKQLYKIFDKTKNEAVVYYGKINNYVFDDPKIKNHKGNIGIATGFGNLIVLDFDDKKIEEEMINKLPSTFTVKTGSGGLHLYYFTDNPESFKILDKEKNTMIDFQGKGKQIVVPPSIHPDTKKPYEVLQDIAIKTIPMAEIKALFSKWIKPKNNIKIENKLNKPPLIEILSKYGVDTSKNPTMCPLGHNSKGGKCFSFTDEVFNCFHCEESGDVISFVMKKDGVDFKAACKTLKINEEKKSIKTDYDSKLDTIKSLKTLLSNIPEQKWRVEGLIPERSITIFGGTSGSYKTWAGMHLALCCSLGINFLSNYSVNPCTVLYIDEENGDITIPNRFKLLKNGMEIKIDIENLFVSIFNNVTLDDLDDTELLRLMIEKFDPKVVILDSMVRMMRGEEDKSKDVKQVFSNLKQHLDQNIAFVILHHTTKRETNTMAGLRGSGDFSAFADSVIMFKGSQKGYCNVNIVKNRHIEIDESCNFNFQLEEVSNGMNLIYKGQIDEFGNINERAADEILQWIHEEKISSFFTESVYNHLKVKAFKKNSVFEGLKILLNLDKIIKLKRGKYAVNQQEVLTVKEELV